MKGLPGKNWIGGFAHPDDEWFAGWPIFQSTALNLGVIFFVDDNRPDATRSGQCQQRLAEFLSRHGIRLLGTLGCRPGFYKERRQDRTIWRAALTDILDKVLADPAFQGARVITHNPMGEYGHPDHIETTMAVLDVCKEPIVITDLCYEGHPSEGILRTYYRGRQFGHFELDRQRYATARSAYQSQFRWTAGEWPPCLTANLFEV